MEIYVSAVGAELKSVREVVAKRLRCWGFSPVWIDVAPDEKADLRDVLNRRVARCKAVIQLVGQHYGPEPSTALQPLGRRSYAQHEAMCARQRGQRVLHFIIGEDFHADAAERESEELATLQATYRRRIRTFAESLESCGSVADLEAQLLRLRGEVFRVRHGTTLRVLALAGAALLLVAAGLWWRQVSSDHPRPDAEVEQSATLFPALRASVAPGRS